MPVPAPTPPGSLLTTSTTPGFTALATVSQSVVVLLSGVVGVVGAVGRVGLVWFVLGGDVRGFVVGGGTVVLGVRGRVVGGATVDGAVDATCSDDNDDRAL